MDVQIFGVKKDADTRKVLRFFKERRIKIHFVDFKTRGPSKGELRRFADKHGVDALIDRDAKRFQALGLQAAYYGADRWIEIAMDEPLILRLPLVRRGQDVTVGYDDTEWKRWLAERRSGHPRPRPQRAATTKNPPTPRGRRGAFASAGKLGR